MKDVHCPKCNAGYRMLVAQWDGSIKCLQCDAVFRIENWVPKLSVKDRRPPRYIGKRLRGFADLLRPLTILIPGIATVMGIIICLGYYGELDLFASNLGIVFLASLLIAFTQGVGQIINQVTDLEIDRINKPYRPLPKGVVSKSDAKIFVAGLMGLVIAGGFVINALFGGMLLVLLFFSAFYSLEPIRAKRRGWGSPLWQATSRGLLSLPVIWAVFANPFSTPVPWIVSSLLFIFLVGAANIKDIPDKAGDMKAGLVTPAIKHGRKLGYYISPFLLAPFVMLPSYVGLGFLPMRSLWLMCLLVLSAVLSYNLIKQKSPTLSILENDINWLGMYLMIGFLYIGFALVFAIK